MTARYVSTGGYTPSEQHLEIVASRYTNSMAGRALIYCHGAGSNGAIDGDTVRSDLVVAAERGLVVGAPLMSSAAGWGNAATVTAIDNYLTYLGTTYGADVTRPMFIADSHGVPCVLNWALYGSGGPARLGAAVLRIPAVNMRQIHDSNIASLAAGMETAYTDQAGLSAAYATRDPSHPLMLAAIRAAGIATRCRIMYNTADPIIRAADVLAFARATSIPTCDLGGPTHSPYGLFDINEEVAWLRSRG